MVSLSSCYTHCPNSSWLNPVLWTHKLAMLCHWTWCLFSLFFVGQDLTMLPGWSQAILSCLCLLSTKIMFYHACDSTLSMIIAVPPSSLPSMWHDSDPINTYSEASLSSLLTPLFLFPDFPMCSLDFPPEVRAGWGLPVQINLLCIQCVCQSVLHNKWVYQKLQPHLIQCISVLKPTTFSWQDVLLKTCILLTWFFIWLLLLLLKPPDN